MQVLKLDLDQSLQEIKQHGSYAFPLQIYSDRLEEYDLGRVSWHWHPEVELVLALKGRVACHAGDTRYDLEEGEGFFANGNVLHQIAPLQGASHHLLSIVLDPVLIGGHEKSTVYQKYVLPVLQSHSLRGLHLRRSLPWQAEMLGCLDRILALNRVQGFGVELAIKAQLSSLWLTMVGGLQHQLAAGASRPLPPDDARIKQMLRFIQDNHASPLRLEEIAASAAISSSECCRCFSRLLGQSPFAYLTNHPLAVAAPLVAATRPPVPATAPQVGPTTTSPFGMAAQKQFGRTPSQYRTMQQSQGKAKGGAP
mgnify:CR=1 FL=1